MGGKKTAGTLHLNITDLTLEDPTADLRIGTLVAALTLQGHS